MCSLIHHTFKVLQLKYSLALQNLCILNCQDLLLLLTNNCGDQCEEYWVGKGVAFKILVMVIINRGGWFQEGVKINKRGGIHFN